MVNLVELARAFTPEGDELTLRQRDEEFESDLMVGKSCRIGARSPKSPCAVGLRRFGSAVRGSSSVGWEWATQSEQRSMRQVLTRASLSRSSSGSDRLGPGTASQPSSSSP